ncbi:MAG TPA: TIGR03936 family radical SAM-associated protein [bacterium]|nr:TIGR03936 family radical SAM-associated protein [bacterium]
MDPLPANVPRNPEALSGIEHPAVLLKIARRGLTRFISHLDWIVLLQQAVFRARLPAALTEGFNKKLKAKYSPPLPTGVASEAEFVEIWLTEPMPPEEIKARLAPKFSQDIVLLEVIPLPQPAPKNPWKEVVAARIALQFEPTEGRTVRQAAVDFLERCRTSEPVTQAPLSQRRKERTRAASFGGDEDLMGSGGGGAAGRPTPAPSARELFEEAGDPRDERETDEHDGRLSPVPESAGPAEPEVNLTEHFGKVWAILDGDAFLRGKTDRLRLVGAFGPNLTLHPMRLALAVQHVAGPATIPIPIKEAVLGKGQDGEWEELF